MIYTFYVDFHYRKVKQDIESSSFREARSKFYTEHQNVAHHIEAVHCNGEVIYTR